MQRSFRYGLFFSLLLIAILTVSGAEAAKKTVAVMPLENISGYSEYRVAEVMSEQLIHVFAESGAYTVVERSQLGSAIKEIGFQSTGAVDQSQAIELGQMTGAQYSIVGKVTMAQVVENQVGTLFDQILRGSSKWTGKYKGKIAVNIRVIDNKTGENVLSTVVEGSKAGNDKLVAFNEACKEAAGKVLNELQKKNPLTGSVLDVENDEMYIDIGAPSGIRVGDILEVVREGRAITNREGKVIAVKHTSLGRVKVIEVDAEYSICRILESSDTVVRGDIVKKED